MTVLLLRCSTPLVGDCIGIWDWTLLLFWGFSLLVYEFSFCQLSLSFPRVCVSSVFHAVYDECSVLYDKQIHVNTFIFYIFTYMYSIC